MKTFFLFLMTFVFALESFAKDCTESHIRSALSSKKKFDFDAEGCSSATVYVTKGIALSSGMTVDGKGKLKLSWKGSLAKCDEIPRGDEAATFYTTGNNNVIKNLTILLSPEGIHVSKGNNNTIDGVRFERICEDAITNGNKSASSAKGTVIKNSYFKNAPDKAIQCNGGTLTVDNSEFRSVPRSIAGCTYKADGSNHGAKECPQPCTITARNNKVYGCSGGYGMRASGYLQKKKKGYLNAYNNYFKDCKTPFIASQYGHIYAENNTSEGSCSQFAKTEQNSTGEVCNNRGCSSEYSGNVVRKCK